MIFKKNSEKIIIQCPECQSKFRVPTGKHTEFSCKKCGYPVSFDDRSLYTKIDESREKKAVSGALVYLFAVVIAFPIVVISNKFIPVDGEFSIIWKIISFIFITAILGVIFKKFQNFILICVGCLLLFLSFGALRNTYTFSDLVFDYRSMMNSIGRSPKVEEIASSGLKPFPNRTEITDAIDYKNPVVRNFAHHAIDKSRFDARKHFKYLTIIQSFAIFKEVKGRWNYVRDPENEEYFSKASETILNAGNVNWLQGDCDDYSILMAACIKAIGGKVRLVRTTGHLYPEILIESRQDLEDLDYIISKELFPNVIDRKNLYFHVDEQERIWLNLDYTAPYPGGKFLIPHVVAILNL